MCNYYTLIYLLNIKTVKDEPRLFCFYRVFCSLPD